MVGVVLSDGEHHGESLHSGPFVLPSLIVFLMPSSLYEFTVLSIAVSGSGRWAGKQ